jgi:hypothetical protein
MKLFSRIFTGLGAFLIVMGIVYALVTREYEGGTEMLTVAGGGLLIGVYLARAVQRARVAVAAQAAGAAPGAADTEPHVPPTIWPLVFALSTIGIVLGSVGPRWVLAAGAVVLVVSLVGWSLDVRRQWRHHDHAAGVGAAHGGAHRRTGP